ncbi:hypothetical protein ACFL0M_10090 [Thermodesulfobacteriota bacterium]
MKEKMLVGLHKDQYGRFDPYLRIYEHILDYNGIKHLRLEASQPGFWEIVAKLDLIIFHWVYIDRDQQMAETLIPIIEKEMQIKCFPNWDTSWHYNNKITQYYLLKSLDFPVIKSYIFWEKDVAEKWIDGVEFPLIFKLNRGALSQDVVLVNDRRQAKRLISRMFGKGIMPGGVPGSHDFYSRRSNLYRTIRHKAWILKKKVQGDYTELWWQKEKNYILFQKFLPENPHTTRVTIIGNSAFAFNIQTVEDDFRAYDMEKIDFDRRKINIDCIKIAFKISNTLGFQCMAYDFLFNENNEPQVCEMGYTSYAMDIYKCAGYWDSTLNWHEGHFWPQYFQLIVLLDLPDLKQPQIDIKSLN